MQGKIKMKQLEASRNAMHAQLEVAETKIEELNLIRATLNEDLLACEKKLHDSAIELTQKSELVTQLMEEKNAVQSNYEIIVDEFKDVNEKYEEYKKDYKMERAGLVQEKSGLKQLIQEKAIQEEEFMKQVQSANKLNQDLDQKNMQLLMKNAEISKQLEDKTLRLEEYKISEYGSQEKLYKQTQEIKMLQTNMTQEQHDKSMALKSLEEARLSLANVEKERRALEEGKNISDNMLKSELEEKNKEMGALLRNNEELRRQMNEAIDKAAQSM